jgi:uncharacterized protein DUF4190
MSEDAQAPGTPEPLAEHAAGAGRIPPGAPADRTPGVPLGKPAADARPAPDPWAPPADQMPGNSAGGPSVHDQPTMISLPESEPPGTPAQGAWANPFPPPGPASAPPAHPAGAPSSGNPFAPPAPAAGTPFAPVAGAPVPPPPIGPEGPGQPPYGYPQYPGQPGYGAPYGAQGGIPGYGWPGLAPVPSNGMGTASLVLGIISVVVFCLWPVSIIIGALAVIFGLIGRRKARRGEATNAGMALAGFICGLVGLVLGVVLLIVSVAAPDSGNGPWISTNGGYSTSLVTHRLP